MQKNETILFREYRTIVDDLWDLKQEIQAQTNEGKKKILIEQYKKLDKQCDSFAMEIKESIILPSLGKKIDNVDEKQLKQSFSAWCTNWAKYIDNMTDEEYYVFVEAENKFYDTQGENKKIASFKPAKAPKQTNHQDIMSR